MSHHLDSPIARQDVRLDITDLYVFRGEAGTALVINVCHSIAGDIPAPGYHPEGKYEFKIDLNGDDVEDVTYRFTFAERASDGSQQYVVRRIAGAEATDPHAQGALIAEGVTGTPTSGSDGTRVWAGKAGDPFWIEPDVLHAVGHAVQDGTVVDLSGWDRAKATNLFAGHTVYSMVLELPDNQLDAENSKSIGVWAVAFLATDAGGWRSINRVGLPMIHPLFTQFNEELGDQLNGGTPSEDLDTYGELLTKEIAGVVNAYGTADDPAAYGRAVAHRLLPNILPYEVGTPAAFSFLGWNGRSLIDNAPDVMFSLAANTPITLGIGKESVTANPTANFPYVPPVS
jgi:hypothetical protein